MDIVFIVGMVALWGVMVLLVAGFINLDKPAEARS